MKNFAILPAATVFASGVFAGNITVKGSDTLVVLAQKRAGVYMGQHPDTMFRFLVAAPLSKGLRSN